MRYVTGLKSSGEPKSYILLEVNEILSRYLYAMFQHYATSLTNILITKLGNDSFCAEGICYYTTCRHQLCHTQYCMYHLIRGENRCSARKPTGSFEFNLQQHLLSTMQNTERKNQVLNNKDLSSNNTEDNNI